jgi:hypothetical protein
MAFRPAELQISVRVTRRASLRAPLVERVSFI